MIMGFNMKKEHLKNIALVLLVAMNLLLGSNILFDKKLWPSGYNFFDSEYFPILRLFEKKAKADKNTIERAVHLTMPEKIIFNTGDQSTRFSVNSDNDEYTKIIENCEDVFTAAMLCSDERIAEVESEEWFSALMTKSVYLSYYTEYETGLFANFLGLRETSLSQRVNTFSNVVISLSDNVSVYFEDSSTKKYYRIRTGNRFEDFKNVTEQFVATQAVENSSQSTINYSFDLNFDKSFGTQKTIIASMVPIYSNTRIEPVVNSRNVLLNDGKFDNGTINKIVRIFGVNSNTARRYTEADGTVVFVENNATLKLHADGVVEYKARGNGISLDEMSGGYSISKLNEFVSSVNDAAGADENIYLSSKAVYGEQNITFDYVCAGMPVKINMPNTENAVSCLIEDGYIKEYKHVLRDYVRTGEYADTPEYITAVDETIQKYSAMTGTVTINKLYLAYTDNGSDGALSAGWCADVEAVIAGSEEE